MALIADVAAWLEFPGTNFGWILLGDEVNAPTARRYDSRENEVAAARPQLTVEYSIVEVPAVTVWGMVAMVLLFLAAATVVIGRIRRGVIPAYASR